MSQKKSKKKSDDDVTKRSHSDETASNQDRPEKKSPMANIHFNEPQKNKFGLLTGIVLMVGWIIALGILAIFVNAV